MRRASPSTTRSTTPASRPSSSGAGAPRRAAERRAVLEGLEAVDWTRLSHAYGPAADVPGLLRQLASTDAEARGAALYELYGNIYHQGTVYEATAHAVPFLVELLRAPELPDKEALLGLLQAIGQGSSYLQVHRPLFATL